MTGPENQPTQRGEPEQFQPVAAVLAVLVPGAGHVYLGEVRRGVCICVGVLGLFFGGMLIGGIDVVDREEDFVWFIGQACVGPIAFGVDAAHQKMYKVHDGPVHRSANPNEIRSPSGAAVVVRDKDTMAPLEFTDPATGQGRMAGPGDRPPNIKSIGRVNEIGTLYGTIAGMMNLICIIDASFHRGRRRREVGL